MLSSTVIQGKTDRPWKMSAFVGNLPGASSSRSWTCRIRQGCGAASSSHSRTDPTIARNSPGLDIERYIFERVEGARLVIRRSVSDGRRGSERAAADSPSSVVRSCRPVAASRRIGSWRDAAIAMMAFPPTATNRAPGGRHRARSGRSSYSDRYRCRNRARPSSGRTDCSVFSPSTLIEPSTVKSGADRLGDQLFRQLGVRRR